MYILHTTITPSGDNDYHFANEKWLRCQSAKIFHKYLRLVYRRYITDFSSIVSRQGLMLN